MERIRTAVDHLEAAPASLLADRALLDRRDRKYLVPAALIPELLGALSPDYLALPAGEIRLARYETTYLDTPSLTSFHDHRRGRPRREKVRIRTYADRDLHMLEVKQRTGRGDTRKVRRPRVPSTPQLSDAERRWLAEVLDDQVRHPALTVSFLRVTLLGRDVEERLTLDLALSVTRGSSTRSLHQLAVVEVKTARSRLSGPAIPWLKRHHYRPTGFSKYCVGLLLTDPSLPRNRFAPLLRRTTRMEASC